jgi:uncharacterized protein
MRRRLAGLFAVMGLITACGTTDTRTTDTRTTDTRTTDTRTTDPGPAGADPDTGALDSVFDPVTLRVFGADGGECVLCLWMAATDEERARGLMQVDDLEGAEGMVFVYDRPTRSSFWMKDTLLALSIVYFTADGAYVGAQDMEPCPSGTVCPSYPAPGEFLLAVEVPQGRLDDLGLVPGSTVELAGPCVPATR